MVKQGFPEEDVFELHLEGHIGVSGLKGIQGGNPNRGKSLYDSA